jgi:hypothetical protein
MKGIFFCKSMDKIDQAILALRSSGYDIEDMGDVNDYLRIILRVCQEARLSCHNPILSMQF